MNKIELIRQNAPAIYTSLGHDYIVNLQSEQGKLSERAYINPLFSMLYVESEKENCKRFNQAIDILKKNSKNSHRIEELKKPITDKGINNTINEIISLYPVLDKGYFLKEVNKDRIKTPDFQLNLYCSKIAVECVSENLSEKYSKELNKHLHELNKEVKNSKEKVVSGIFAPEYSKTLNNVVKKYRTMKTSMQTKGYKYKILMISFVNDFFKNPEDAAPFHLFRDRIYSGLIYNAFYGRRGNILFHGSHKYGEEHHLEILSQDGKFAKKDDTYNLAILHFNYKRKKDEYVFYENIINPLPYPFLRTLISKFNPEEQYSVLNKYINKSKPVI